VYLCGLAHIEHLSLIFFVFSMTIFYSSQLYGIGSWSSGCTLVTGGENILIGNQEFQVIFAPVSQCLAYIFF
jgi:hypothetical protein